MNKERQELKDLSIAFASEIKKFQKIIANDPSKIDKANADSDKNDPATNSQIQSCMSAIYNVANNLHDRMDRMQASMWNYQDSHASGHFPACPSTEHMEGALKALGWSKNFEVKKKQIQAAKELFTYKP